MLALGSRHLGTRFLPEKERTNVTDLGEFIRESIEEWVRVRKGKPDEPKKDS